MYNDAKNIGMICDNDANEHRSQEARQQYALFEQKPVHGIAK
jgi:hypothetical protein